VKLLLFGATGLAGSGVLRACLDAPQVTEVRAVVRRSTGVSDPRLREFLHGNYLEYLPIADAFTSVDACFFCLGVSVSKAPVEANYRRIHQAYPMAAATMLRATSPAAPFQYLSGKSTDLNSRWMWARVKAEAERDLIATFDANCFRPGMIDGKGPSSQTAIVEGLRPVLRAIFKPFRSMYIENIDIGRAMLEATTQKLRRRIVENPEIRDLADRYRRSS
jgi:uncharacterized protein YbjT (DUF2867 family)